MTGMSGMLRETNVMMRMMDGVMPRTDPMPTNLATRIPPTRRTTQHVEPDTYLSMAPLAARRLLHSHSNVVTPPLTRKQTVAGLPRHSNTTKCRSIALLASNQNIDTKDVFRNLHRLASPGPNRLGPVKDLAGRRTNHLKKLTIGLAKSCPHASLAKMTTRHLSRELGHAVPPVTSMSGTYLTARRPLLMDGTVQDNTRKPWSLMKRLSTNRWRRATDGLVEAQNSSHHRSTAFLQQHTSSVKPVQ